MLQWNNGAFWAAEAICTKHYKFFYIFIFFICIIGTSCLLLKVEQEINKKQFSVHETSLCLDNQLESYWDSISFISLESLCLILELWKLNGSRNRYTLSLAILCTRHLQVLKHLFQAFCLAQSVKLNRHQMTNVTTISRIMILYQNSWDQQYCCRSLV